MSVILQHKRAVSTGTGSWATINPVLEDGELGWESDTNRIKIGNGTTAWNSLSYISSPYTPPLTLTPLTTGFSIAGGTTSKTLTVSNTMTLAGTDSRTYTFPATNATIARTDAAQTFTGTQTFSSSINSPGIETVSAGEITIATANLSPSSNITIRGGSASAGNGGSISIQNGTGTSGGVNGSINIGTSNTPTEINLGTTSSNPINLKGSINIGDGWNGVTGATIYNDGTIYTNKEIYSSTDGTFVGQMTSNTIVTTGLITAGTNITFTGKSSSTTEQVSGYHLNQAGWILPSRTGGTPLFSHRYGASGTVSMLQFLYNGNTNGTINVASGGTPAFASGSDYRMKTDISPITNAIERMKNAKAYTFYKIAEVDPSDTLHTGFLAHELVDVQPDAVLGEKDAVDEEGKPIYQEVMESKIIPVMAQAINDLIYMVEGLKAEVEALKTS
jgi:hypothetical protein